jgi:ankyrin repeat protein/ketosteroid isomerase-like protein
MTTEQTRSTVAGFFTNLEHGDLPAAMAAFAPDAVLELPRDEWNAVIPYLGVHHGTAEIERAFAIRAETTQVLDYGMRGLVADGDKAVAVIYTRAAHTGTGREFEIEDAHHLVVDDAGRIVSWKVYFDPNGEIAAFTENSAQRLVDAAWAGARETVQELLAAGAPADARDPASGLTALMIAAGRGDLGIVRVLLDAGADVHTTDSRAGATALHKACQGGSLEVVQALVQAGAFIDAVVPTTGHTPLLEAFWYKWPDIVGYLLEQDAAVNLGTHYGFSMEEHFAYTLNVNVLGKERLQAAARLLEQRRRQDEEAARDDRLLAAVVADDVDAVRRLLAEGADTEIRFPVVNGFNDAHTPLLVAARDGHEEIVRILIEAGAQVNATEPTFGAVPLHKAVYNGHAEITRTLVAVPGIDLDFQGATNGYTPLHDALWHGFEECSRVLLAAGARLDLVGHDGKTPLDVAVENFGAGHDLSRALAEAEIAAARV